MKKFLYLLLIFPVLVAAQTGTQNYVKTYVYKDYTTSSDPDKAQVSVTYVDGLGRPIQQVAGKASATGKDIVTHIEYDKYNRTQREYLPYVPGTSDFSFTDGAKAATITYYGSSAELENTANPFSRTRYEASPLNRVLKKAAPGNPWAMDTVANNDHTIKFAYLTNTANDKVLRKSAVVAWSTIYNLYMPTPTITSNGTYAAGELYKTITQDENKTGNIYTGSAADNADASLKYNTVEEYKNKQGQLVLKRSFNAKNIGGTITPEVLDTYYFYDQFGNLAYVCSPLAMGMFSDTARNEYSYQYRYDARNRLAEKKLPGRQWEFILYDPLDRVVATGPAQDPFGGTQVGWVYTYYDVFGRVAFTGWVPQATGSLNSTKRNAMQQAITTVNNVSRGPQTVDGVLIDYKPGTLPANFKLLTVNYYDNYTFPGAPSTLPATVEGENIRTNVKGLATGSWVRVLTGATAQLADVTYTLYDIKGRPVRSYTKNYLGGYTMADSKLGFDGKAQYTITKHKRVATDAELTTREDFTYTPQDRLLGHTHKINTLTPELLGLNEYTELGQLKSKKVGGTDITGAAPLQKVDYTYNVRGWLKEINDAGNLLGTGQPQDLFAFEINYNNGITFHTTNSAVPLFNGNIAETTWRTAGDNIQRRYCYSYDKLNRLTNAWYQMPQASYPERSSYDEQLQYDRNGNITSLQRNGGLDTQAMPVQIDDLAYTTYSGNKLMKVTDNSLSPQGFKDVDVANTDDFSYDGYGNMTADLNKGITQITYNHLNLPVKIIFNGNETTKIEYLYDAVGSKVKKTVTNGTVTVTHYIGGFQYAGEVLEFFPTSEGYVKYTQPRAIFDPGQYNYVYNYTDHLGNIRLSYTLDPQDNVLKILEENHYYPFGLKHKGYLSEQNIIISGDPNVMIVPYVEENPQRLRLTYNYKYNGKELQDELGLNMYDYGARNYDPALGRWMNMDPLAEKSRKMSPYVYAANNPVVFIDPDGMAYDVFGNEEGGGDIGALKKSPNKKYEEKKNEETIYQLDKEVNKAYGKKADEAATYGNETIDEVISKVPTLKRLRKGFGKKVRFEYIPKYVSMKNAEAVTSFDIPNDKEPELGDNVYIRFFQASYGTYRNLAHTILHEFGHVDSMLYGNTIKNYYSNGRNVDLTQYLDELYAYQYAFNNGGRVPGMHVETDFYWDFLGKSLRLKMYLDMEKMKENGSIGFGK